MASTDDVIDRIYQAASRPEEWTATLGAFAEHLDAETGLLYARDPRQTKGVMEGAATSLTYGYDPAWIARYVDHYYALDPFVDAIAEKGAGHIVTDRDVAEPASVVSFDRSEFYRDWAGPQGLRHVVAQALHSSDRQLVLFGAWRGPRRGAYEAADLQLFARLARHALRAIDIGGRLAAAEAEMDAMADRRASAVFVLRADGRVKRLNAAADRLVTQGGELTLRNGRLWVAVPQDRAALDRLVAAALDPRFASWAENAVLPLRRAGDRLPLIARVIAVARHFAPFGAEHAASVILTVEDPEDEARRFEALLVRRFGLSSAQARVALQFRDGRTIAEASTALKLAPETVRSHLKVIFQRTGTRRQAELAVLLRQTTEG
ncbi:LuxR family transcriptional regulator [Aureimonas endophytica]|uniref:LuxR family transcriptional regulator n=1 Tax=Aureimonas endophytica TaxID=2027858 RepID=A0A917A1L1_9HYPH|nr:helix-turn-helix transcriptional regulator [Aureimonas endophytica]GGE20331.1 LuxR family transcriptional regulator [Aureimonas endophytica]